MIPAIAAGSSRPSFARAAVPSLTTTTSASLPARRTRDARLVAPRSLRLLSGQQHEYVLKRGGADNRIVGDGAVDGALGADDRDRGPGRAHRQPLPLGDRPHFGQAFG